MLWQTAMRHANSTGVTCSLITQLAIVDATVVTWLVLVVVVAMVVLAVLALFLSSTRAASSS
jgi:hypothetical protein